MMMTSASDRVAEVFRSGGDFLDMVRAVKEAKMSKHVRVCRWRECGKTFETNDSRQVYCCEECRRLAEYAREREKTARRQRQRELFPSPGRCVVHDPFTCPDFYGADGLPGLRAQVCPMGGMYSQPEHKEVAA